MTYDLSFTNKADKEIATLKKTDTAAYKKLEKLLLELIDHPYTGTGRPKPLKHDLAGYYSRRITQKHRLVYSIDDNNVIVLVLSAESHYEDK